MSVAISATVTIDLSKLVAFRKQVDDQLNHRQEGGITKAFKQWGVIYRSFVKERFDIFSKGGGDWPPLKDTTKQARRVGKVKGAKGKIEKPPKRPKAKKLKSSTGNVAKGARSRSRIVKYKRQLKNVKGPFLKRLKTRLRLNKKIRTERARQRGSKRSTLVKQNRKAMRKYKEAKKEFLNKRKFGILRDTGTLFAVLSPTFSGIAGQYEEDIPFGIRVGYGGNAGHPSAKKATIADIANYHQTGAGHLPVRTIIVAPSQAVVAQMTEIMQRAIKVLT